MGTENSRLQMPTSSSSSTWVTPPQTSSSSSISEKLETPVADNEQPDIEKQPTNTSVQSPGLGQKQFPETDLSQGIVGWDGQDDPANPQNFTATRKWLVLGLISAFTLVSPLASSMFSPAVSYMAADLGETNETILSFTVSIFLIGYVVRLYLSLS